MIIYMTHSYSVILNTSYHITLQIFSGFFKKKKEERGLERERERERGIIM